ncbi:type IV pilus biogenesis protein EbsA [Merismopedia glauca]|uniref:Uncharacterized protein n=1 Tax=Merismopedia glauca CCAP 1448/3 TaxID=1296344 RepID=A0A2T1C0R3_9CYAN|nr:type IV pilus biogenesis protein EbsA [Merismopedia glauca]PSB01794.1 hypothetical protein C7B64_16525 [Merismopedia glauca CCAP 1448/3]
MQIENLKPAITEDVRLYAPFCPQAFRDSVLPQALTLYNGGFLEGERYIEGGQGIPFVATWQPSKLPLDLTRCRLQFDGNPELSYEVTMQNSELVKELIDVINNYQRTKHIDFPQSFYKKLLRVTEQTQV